MNQIKIMRADPVIICNGQEGAVVGRQRELFRLLILNEGRTVSKDLIAQLRDTNTDTVRSKVRYLRDQMKEIGCDNLIKTDRSSGYRVCLQEWQVDAWEFRDTVEPLAGRFDVEFATSLSIELARNYADRLKRVLALWHENPAANLPHELGFGATFDELKRRADDLLLIARLRSGEIREAIQALEHKVRYTPDDATWELLLLAHDAAGSQLATTWEKIIRHYTYRGQSTRIPAKLSDLMSQLSAGASPNPFRVLQETKNSDAIQAIRIENSSDDAQSLLSLCSTLGITTASQLRLADSHLTPHACIQRTRKRLLFAGVLASKWVIDPAIRNGFDQLLARLDASNGEVRFLVINPAGDAFKRLNDLRDGNISTESIAPLKLLADQHRSLQVRLYDHLPAFRIVVIDDDVVSFSPYRLAAEAYLASGRGWEAPHVVLDPMANYPLAEAFLMVFAETWGRATPIGDVL